MSLRGHPAGTDFHVLAAGGSLQPATLGGRPRSLRLRLRRGVSCVGDGIGRRSTGGARPVSEYPDWLGTCDLSYKVVPPRYKLVYNPH